jgi:thioredoxin-like negative regulator of GroEL
MSLKTVTAEEFDALVESAPWLVANFVREGCPWCARMIEPLNQLDGIIGEKVEVVRLYREAAPDAFDRFAVKGVPVTLLFKQGALREIATGGDQDTMDWLASLEELADA